MIAGLVDMHRESVVARNRLALLVEEGRDPGAQQLGAGVEGEAPFAIGAIPMLDEAKPASPLRPEIGAVEIELGFARVVDRGERLVPFAREELLELILRHQLRDAHVASVREIELQRARIVKEGRRIDGGEIDVRVELVALHDAELGDDDARASALAQSLGLLRRETRQVERVADALRRELGALLVILDAAHGLRVAAQLLEHADEAVDLASDAVEGDRGLAARLQGVELFLRPLIAVVEAQGGARSRGSRLA